MSKSDGYRYIRGYWSNGTRENYALYEVQSGKARRVGTVRSYTEAEVFLGITAA